MAELHVDCAKPNCGGWIASRGGAVEDPNKKAASPGVGEGAGAGCEGELSGAGGASEERHIAVKLMVTVDAPTDRCVMRERAFLNFSITERVALGSSPRMHVNYIRLLVIAEKKTLLEALLSLAEIVELCDGA